MFLDRFIGRLAALKNAGIPTMVCGDYNIAHHDIDVFDRHRPRRLDRCLSSGEPRTVAILMVGQTGHAHC